MHVDQARALHSALGAAIERALRHDATDVDLLGAMQAMDDAARDELQAAIDVAAQGAADGVDGEGHPD